MWGPLWVLKLCIGAFYGSPPPPSALVSKSQGNTHMSEKANEERFRGPEPCSSLAAFRGGGAVLQPGPLQPAACRRFEILRGFSPGKNSRSVIKPFRIGLDCEGETAGHLDPQVWPADTSEVDLVPVDEP